MINEGRLVDFLSSDGRFSALRTAVLDPEGRDGGTVINLNARSVVAGRPGESILDAC